jgi:arylsulfatase A-like enzyme
VCVSVLPARYILCASRTNRRQRDELGFDYFFESHDGIQAPPFIYFEDGKPVSNLIKNEGMWSWEAAKEEPRYALNPDYDWDYQWLPSFEKGSDGAKSELTCKTSGEEVQCTSKDGENHFVRYGYEGFSTTHTGEVYVQAAKGFLWNCYNKGEPFFLQYASQGVHTPHTPPTKFFGEEVRGTQETPHLDMVHEVDLQLKKLMDWLDRNDLKSNTLVILTSDNGGLDKSGSTEHRASGTLHAYKGTDWEGGHRVPFFVRWPEVAPRGVTCDQPMVLTDLFATFAELTGRSKFEDSKKQGMDSTSIYQHLVNTEAACGLNGNSPVPREAILVQQTKDSANGAKILEGKGQTIVAVSQDHLKVVANRYHPNANKGLPEAAIIGKKFRYVDLGAIESMAPATQTEKQASMVYDYQDRSNEGTPEAAGELYLELRRKMKRVRDNLRTTPPLCI